MGHVQVGFEHHPAIGTVDFAHQIDARGGLVERLVDQTAVGESQLRKDPRADGLNAMPRNVAQRLQTSCQQSVFAQRYVLSDLRRNGRLIGSTVESSSTQSRP